MLSRATHARVFPQNGLLLERLAIRLDNGEDRLPRRRRIGMDQEQDLRLLVIDAAINVLRVSIRVLNRVAFIGPS